MKILENYLNEQQGQGGTRMGQGGTDQCVCPSCGTKVKHVRNVPCITKKCPKCGTKMTGYEAPYTKSK